MSFKSSIKSKIFTDFSKAIKTAYYSWKYKHIEYIKNVDLIDKDPFDISDVDDYETETRTTESKGEPVKFHVNIKQYYPYTLYRTDSGDGTFPNISGDVAGSGNTEAS